VTKADLEFSSRRIYRFMTVLTLVGTIVSALYGGVSWAVGFLTGAVFSGVNFWFWHRLVQRVGQAAGESRSGSSILFGIRYFVFFGGVYATIRYFEASLSAALTGIFVAVAAVFLEILFELFYGT
jgi:hypothetical protein